ncbi:hypothetical protein [Lyngbya aestuarii]|uniref:hypothetical protein n=1 Tax=Lyngbya aestuarii TaxID=118322 RepID=UPI00403DD1CC
MRIPLVVDFFVAQSPPTPIPTPTSTPTPSLEVQLLTKQLELLQDANTQMASSFQAFVSALNLSFIVIGLVLGILGVIGAFFYGKTISEVKQTVGMVATREVERIVSVTIKDRVDYLQRVLEQEEVIGWVSVDYLLPTGQGTLPPKEFQFLKARGFQDVQFRYKADKVNRRSHILVLDLVNHQFTEEEVALIVRQIADNFYPKSILVVYVDYRISAVDELLKNKRFYSAPANTPITLMGTVVNSAYMAYALRRADDT